MQTTFWAKPYYFEGVKGLSLGCVANLIRGFVVEGFEDAFGIFAARG
jgi:hypothetical protein